MKMHFSKLIKTPGVVITQPPVKNDTTNDNNSEAFEQILDILKQNQSSVVSTNNIEEDTNLDDEEINDVLSMLLEFQDKYFTDIPLSRDLCKKFMWNIPKNVYKAAVKARNYGYDFINPLILFYVFCVDEPDFAIGKFMHILLNALTDEDYAVIESKASEYDFAYNEEGYDEEDNGSDTEDSDSV